MNEIGPKKPPTAAAELLEYWLHNPKMVKVKLVQINQDNYVNVRELRDEGVKRLK